MLGNERVIDTIQFTDALDLFTQLTTANHEWLDVGVQLPDGSHTRSFQIVETTLSDGSKVVDLRFVAWVAEETAPAPTRCIEHHDSLPYSSEHVWKAEIHGLPHGRCIKCGEDYLAYSIRTLEEIRPLLEAPREDPEQKERP